MLPLCRLHSASVEIAGEPVLHQLCWKIERGEHWSVSGPNGSGKSTFLRLVRGDLHPVASDKKKDQRVYGLADRPETDPLVTDGEVALVGPALHEKFQQIDRAITGREIIASGFDGTVFLQSKITGDRKQKLDRMQFQPALDRLWNRVFQECSQGQQRLLLLARALVAEPTLLLLDEMANGLDQSAIRDIHRLLADWITGHRATVSTSHRPGDLAPFVNRFATINEGRLRLSGKTASVKTGQPGKPRTQKSSQTRKKPWLELQNVSIHLGNTTAVENLNWQVAPGEHWAVTGPNGSGKTTLLRTLYGELQPSGDSVLKRFGKDTCSWSTVRRRMALFYPAMVHDFDPSERVIDTLRSGFNGCIGRYPRLNAVQREEIQSISAILRINDLRERNLHELSHGQTRRVLLARCLLDQPDIVLLDEPFDGLDTASHKAVLDLLNDFRHHASVVIGTHHPDELPNWINRRLKLDKSRKNV